MLTGDQKLATNVGWFSINGGPAQQATQSAGGNLKRFVSRNVSNGVYEVRTWRQNASGQKISGSEMIFYYSVGGSTGTTSQTPSGTSSPTGEGTSSPETNSTTTGEGTSSPEEHPK
jgi:hypothetical protein